VKTSISILEAKRSSGKILPMEKMLAIKKKTKIISIIFIVCKMMRMKRLLKNSDTLTEFLNKNNAVAVIGVSADPDKWGSKIYKTLKSSNFNVYPVNPKYKKIGDDICYPDLKALPKKPDVVITVVPPRVTEQIVKACKEAGISRVWMQPGSESEKAINFCKNNDIKVVYNTCFVADGLGK